MIRIIIADDDPIIISGLSMIIEAHDSIELVGTAGNGREAVKLCLEKCPDVALLDIRMPDMDGILAAEMILKGKASGSEVTVSEKCFTAPLLLTTFDEPELIDRALNAGVRGFILKNSPVDTIISAIITVAKGGTVFAPDVVDYIRTNKNSGGSEFFTDLTPREKEIVDLIASGLSNAEIAQRLFLSNGTVRNYISLILEKTGLEHRTQIAVRFYLGG